MRIVLRLKCKICDMMKESVTLNFPKELKDSVGRASRGQDLLKWVRKVSGIWYLVS